MELAQHSVYAKGLNPCDVLSPWFSIQTYTWRMKVRMWMVVNLRRFESFLLNEATLGDTYFSLTPVHLGEIKFCLRTGTHKQLSVPLLNLGWALIKNLRWHRISQIREIALLSLCDYLGLKVSDNKTMLSIVLFFESINLTLVINNARV